MRIAQKRNVFVLAIILASALATAAWFTSATSRAELSRVRVENVQKPILAPATSSTFNRFATNQPADPLAPPIWEPVVLTSAQIEIKTWAVQGTTYAYLKFLFPNAGYRVVAFAAPTRNGNDFTGDASVEKFNGASVQAVTTTAGIYDLGAITPGSYSFTFKNSGASVKSLAFTVAAPPFPANSIDNAREFVKEQYRDFLNREADPGGENFWTDNIAKCSDPVRRPAGQTEAQCTLRQRETTSGAFFLSPEFQYTGYFVYRMFQGGLGRQPKLSEFTPDAQLIGAGIVVNGQLSGAKINQNKADYAQQFVNCTDANKYRCSEFKAIYDGLSNQQYVDKLFQTTGVNASASDRTALVNGLSANPATETRASVLQKVVDGINVISEGNQQFTTTYGLAFYNAESNRAFVQFQYFGYMKRDPDDAGYAFWLDKLNKFGGNFVNAEMVLAFISSPEYRERFMVVAKGARVVIDKPSVFFPATIGSTQLTARILDARGAPLPGNVTWTSTAPDKVSVDATGKLMSKAIGSAQIIAEAPGVRSAPTLVIIAQPQPGAVLITDAQVVSVGPPLGLAPGAVPGVGTQYEVTLLGVNSPATGTLLIAAETAPIAGRVVATRQTAGGVVVTLAVAPLYELFSAYDIDLAIDLSSFPTEAVPESSALATENAIWQPDQSDKIVKAVARTFDGVAAFKAFKCDAKLEPKLGSPPIELSVENNLSLILEDTPGYTKHLLVGSAALKGNAGLKLKAGFEAEGKCEAQVKINVPVGGWFSLLVMPAVRFGVGLELKGEITVIEAELGVEGSVELKTDLGWECGGPTPGCRGLNDVTLFDKFETKSKFPSQNDKKAKVSAQFYAIVGLDAVFLLFAHAEIVEARVGPKQSFEIAFEDDQAAKTDYASSYDLKIDGVVEPGPGLKEAIKKVIADDSTSVKLEAKFSKDISESPKGTFTISETTVAATKPVDFTVMLDQKTVSYFLLGYNVQRVELWRKRDDESEFTRWNTMNRIATNKATYKWVPTASDAGTYEFAAFVATHEDIPVPLLEVSPNSIKELKVRCTPLPTTSGFGSKASQFAMGLGIGAQANTCFEGWVGTATIGSTQFGTEVTSQLSIKLNPDRKSTGPFGEVQTHYYAEGTMTIHPQVRANDGTTCTTPQYVITLTRDNWAATSVFYKSEVNDESVISFVTGMGTIKVPITTTCTNDFGTRSETSQREVKFLQVPGEIFDEDGGFKSDKRPSFSFDFERP